MSPPPGAAASWILVVDDDEDIRDIVQMVLEASGYNVRTAANGLEALEILQDVGLPSLVLLDLMMPQLSGGALARRLRSSPRSSGLPIVLMSGDVRAQEVAAQVDANACLLKPVELDALLEVVSRFAWPASGASELEGPSPS